VINIASHVRAQWWTAISLVLVCIAVVVGFATKPPAKRRVVVTDTVIEILHDVSFVGDTISTRSLRTLDAVAATLEGNPNIRLIEVQASTETRAQACIDYLIGQGVAPNRLVAGTTDSPRAAFLILERWE
jgi:hypothetical protein